MGCVNSAADDKSLDANASEEQKRKQRRRLSVDPKHVNSGVDDSKEAKAADSNKNSEGEESQPVEGVDLNAAMSAVEQECAARFTGGYAVESRKGLVPYNRNKVNQDRALFKLGVQSDPQLSLFGVMDGHGEFGHFVAGFVQEKLPQNLALQTELKTKTRDAILAATDVTCKQLAKSGINCTFSGTTCVYAVQVADRLFVANIGDSRCVLCRVPPNPPAAGALPFECIALSNDQKPDVKAEKERILAAGGRVEPLPGPPGEDCGPPRVWLPEVDVPGLAMSRSIGDEISQRVGVISVPEILEHKIEANDMFAVWASDGVWEFLSNEQACEIVWKSRHNLRAAARELTLEASKKWKMEEEVIDDITCVIIGFNKPK